MNLSSDSIVNSSNRVNSDNVPVVNSDRIASGVNSERIVSEVNSERVVSNSPLMPSSCIARAQPAAANSGSSVNAFTKLMAQPDRERFTLHYNENSGFSTSWTGAHYSVSSIHYYSVFSIQYFHYVHTIHYIHYYSLLFSMFNIFSLFLTAFEPTQPTPSSCPAHAQPTSTMDDASPEWSGLCKLSVARSCQSIVHLSCTGRGSAGPAQRIPGHYSLLSAHYSLCRRSRQRWAHAVAVDAQIHPTKEHSTVQVTHHSLLTIHYIRYIQYSVYSLTIPSIYTHYTCRPLPAVKSAVELLRHSIFPIFTRFTRFTIPYSPYSLYSVFGVHSLFSIL